MARGRIQVKFTIIILNKKTVHANKLHSESMIAVVYSIASIIIVEPESGMQRHGAPAAPAPAPNLIFNMDS
jgi:pyruvate/2-oxoglutarate/acetoin dehydrogenase E1 component